MTKHAQIETQLSVYRTLDQTEKQAVDQHLATCPTCRAKLGAYQQQEQMLAEFVEQRQQALLKEYPATSQLGFQQLIEQQAQRPAWFSRWRFGYYWSMQQRQRPLFAVSLLIVLFLIMTITVTLDGIGSLPVIAQPTPIPTDAPTVVPTSVPTPVSTPQRAAQQGIEEALAREVAFWGTEQDADFAQFIDPAADETWRGMKIWSLKDSLEWEWNVYQRPSAHVLNVELLADDVALADIEMTFPANPSKPWQATRVYRHAADHQRWYWSQPPAELWGEARELETEHLLFKYRERDAAIIEQIAPRIEDAYLKLHDTLHLSPETTREPSDLLYDQKITLEIVPQDAIRGKNAAPVYRVSSPSLYASPQSSLSITDTAAAAIFHALIVDVADKARGDSAYPVMGARGWSLLASELILWLLDDSLSMPFTEQLRNHDDLVNFLVNHRHLLLHDPNNRAVTTFPETATAIRGMQAAYATLIDYMVSAYGREVIPVLVREMAGGSATWEELIPAVFKVSLAEFEAGWNAWLLAEYPDVQETEAVRAAIEASLTREAQVRSANDPTRQIEYLDPDADEEWRSLYRQRYFYYTPTNDAAPIQISMELVELVVNDDRAQVRVRTHQTDSVISGTMERRFYRQVGDRWLLTSPDEAEWGKTHALTTTSFHIEYRELDAAVVEAAAPELEAAYLKLLQTLDLPKVRPASSNIAYYQGSKFHVEVVAAMIDEWRATETVLRQSSPFLDPWLESVDPVDVFTYSVMTHISMALLREAQGGSYPQQWSNLVVNQWLLEDSMQNPPWRWSEYMAGLTQEFLVTHYPLQMDIIGELEPGNDAFVVGNLLMEQIAEVYGRETIAPFVRGLANYDNWEELIPAVFAVTVAEFEADWNAWLAARYQLGQPELDQSELEQNMLPGIHSPSAGSVVSGTVEILGTATHENFATYELHFKPASHEDESYIYFSGSSVAVVEGHLGFWETTNLPPGSYALRLRVMRENGDYAEYLVPDLMVNDLVAK